MIQYASDIIYQTRLARLGYVYIEARTYVSKKPIVPLDVFCRLKVQKFTTPTRKRRRIKRKWIRFVEM